MVTIEPTKLTLVGTRPTCQTPGAAGLCVRVYLLVPASVCVHGRHDVLQSVRSAYCCA